MSSAMQYKQPLRMQEAGANKVYSQVLGVLQQHVSTLNAQSLLNNALRDCRLTQDKLNHDNVRQVINRLSRGLMLFAGAHRFQTAMESLNEIAPAADVDKRSVSVQSESDINEVRSTVRAMCERLGGQRLAVQKVATIASELARNIVLYAGKGHVELRPTTKDTPSIQVRAVDHGPGIDNLDDVLSGRHRSRTGLGKGLLGTKRLANHFDVQTGPSGTTVDAEVRL
jgi:serine/threonine-protein kinase RsbT